MMRNIDKSQLRKIVINETRKVLSEGPVTVRPEHKQILDRIESETNGRLKGGKILDGSQVLVTKNGIKKTFMRVSFGGNILMTDSFGNLWRPILGNDGRPIDIKQIKMNDPNLGLYNERKSVVVDETEYQYIDGNLYEIVEDSNYGEVYKEVKRNTPAYEAYIRGLEQKMNSSSSIQMSDNSPRIRYADENPRQSGNGSQRSYDDLGITYGEGGHGKLSGRQGQSYDPKPDQLTINSKTGTIYRSDGTSVGITATEVATSRHSSHSEELGTGYFTALGGEADSKQYKLSIFEYGNNKSDMCYYKLEQDNGEYKLTRITEDDFSTLSNYQKGKLVADTNDGGWKVGLFSDTINKHVIRLIPGMITRVIGDNKKVNKYINGIKKQLADVENGSEARKAIIKSASSEIYTYYKDLAEDGRERKIAILRTAKTLLYIFGTYKIHNLFSGNSEPNDSTQQNDTTNTAIDNAVDMMTAFGDGTAEYDEDDKVASIDSIDGKVAEIYLTQVEETVERGNPYEIKEKEEEVEEELKRTEEEINNEIVGLLKNEEFMARLYGISAREGKDMPDLKNINKEDFVGKFADANNMPREDAATVLNRYISTVKGIMNMPEQKTKMLNKDLQLIKENFNRLVNY